MRSKKEYKSYTFDGRDLHRLMEFLPEKDLEFFGYCRKHGFDKSIIAKFPAHIFVNKKNREV